MRLLYGLLALILVAPAQARTVLTHSPTYYVDPTNGVDAPLEVCENAATPCKYLFVLRNTLFTSYDLAMQIVTVRIVDGDHQPYCFGISCGPYMQHWSPLPGQTSPGNFIIEGNCANPNAVTLHAALPPPGYPVGQSIFDVSGAAQFTTRCMKWDATGSNADILSMNFGGTVVIDRVTFKGTTSITNAANSITCNGGTLLITGPLTFDGGNPQAGIYAGQGCQIYLNVNNIPGLFGFTFLNTPNYSTTNTAFLWAEKNAGVNLQGLTVSGAITGRFAVVRHDANVDLGATPLSAMPGTLPSIGDGATGGSLTEDGQGNLKLWSIPAGIISGMARSPRIDCLGISGSTDCELKPSGGGAVNLNGNVKVQGIPGVTGTKTVWKSYFTTCTLVFTQGILTGGTC